MEKLIKSIIKYLVPNLSRKYLIWKYKRHVLPEEFTLHLNSLKKGDIVVDVGANIGLVTECLAKTGADVISIEPNKNAYNLLSEVANRYNNITSINAAAGVENRKVKLFLHRDTSSSNQDLTQASSLLGNKPNVSSDIFEEVEEIDFAQFILSKGCKIDLLKIDIEGYEIELVHHMLDKGAFENISKVYLETHELKFIALKDATLELKARIKREGLEEKFFYLWH